MKRAILIGLVWASVAGAVEIKVTVPDDSINDVRNAFAETYGWQATLPNPTPSVTPGVIDNPEGKLAFTKRKIAEHVKEVLRAWRINGAVKVTRDTEVAKPDPVIE